MTMSGKFQNTPGRPLGFEESRKRVQEIAQKARTGKLGGEQVGVVKTGGLNLEAGDPEPESQISPEKQNTRPARESEGQISPENQESKASDLADTPTHRQTETPSSSEFSESLNLPLTQIEIEAGLKESLDKSVRWLATWCERQIKKLTPQNFKGRERASLEMVTLEVRLPKNNEIEIGAAQQMFAAFASLSSKGWFGGPQRSLCFEILGEKERISFLVSCPEKWQDLVEKQIHGAYPVAEIEQVAEPQVFTREGEVAFTVLKKTGQPYFPIRTFEELQTDSLNSLTAAMSKLDEGEKLIWQLLIHPADDKWRRRGQSFLQSAQAPPDPEKKTAQIKIDPKVIEAVQKKISQTGFEVVLRLAVVAQDKINAESHLKNLVSAFEQFNLPHLGGFKQSKPRFAKAFAVDFVYCYWPSFPAKPGGVFNTEELATLYHFPNQEVQTPHIHWLGAKRSAPPADLPGEGLYLGLSTYRGVEKKVNLLPDDRRRHMYIIGQTGTGKSEFLKFMAQQDMAEGRGLAFIDPHGDGVEDLLQMVPRQRAEDVIYFDPGHSERPMGLNILEASTEEGKHMAINAFIALLYKLYDPGHTGIMGPMLERAIRNTMLTVMEEEGSTLIEVMRILTDPDFAREKVDLIKDPLVKRFWTDQIAKTSDFHKSEQLGYFVSKFDRFVTEKLMRNIIGQGKSAFNFRQVMDEGKILLVNLSKGKIGEENSNFLGLLLVPRLLIAAMSRVDLPEKERRDFYLYVDEFQNFATPDFVQILSEARKYRLSLTVGNQFIGQLDEKIKDAVFGNVGTSVIFRVGTEDAAYLEKHFEPVFDQQDLMNNKIGQAYMRLLIGGQPSAPFSIKTDWEAIQGLSRNKELAEEIKQLSYLRFGRDREVVENEIRLRAKLD